MKKTAASVGGRTVVKMAALLITLTTLAGCGQKGPLTLPKPAASAPVPAASAPAR